jgi:hypothetical protein
MARSTQMKTAGLVLVLSLLLPVPVRAGPIRDYLLRTSPSCSPTSYSPLRYWAPPLMRLHDHCHGPKVSVYPSDRYPWVPSPSVLLPYNCPSVPPAVLVGERHLLP